MRRFGLFVRLGAATAMSLALSIGLASVAQAKAAPVPVSTQAATPASVSNYGTALLISNGRVVVVPSSLQQPINAAQLVASWNAKLPALKAGLARGESLAVALQGAGLPAITGHAVSGAATTTGGVHPDAKSCQDWTCGYEFDAYGSYTIEWLVWAGVISGPGLICYFLGPESFGFACLVAGTLWGIVSAYSDYGSPPPWTGRCIYIGVGFGEVAFWEKC